MTLHGTTSYKNLPPSHSELVPIALSVLSYPTVAIYSTILLLYNILLFYDTLRYSPILR